LLLKLFIINLYEVLQEPACLPIQETNLAEKSNRNIQNIVY